MAAPTALPPAPADGLPPATAAARLSARDKLVGLGLVAAVCLALSAAKGHWPPPAGVWGIIGLGVLFIGLKLLRDEISAGPGWFASQGLVRRRWVRTDQLVKATAGRSGIDRIVVLTDRDGRRVGVLYSALATDRDLRQRVAQDVRRSVDDGLVLGAAAARALGAERQG
ncbi:MAG: hypothetical protein LC789_02785 [Actinobacteria bacterium]|nr:hypothetical protein [Actinomycetota bacterium]MCA1721200.1 hypothetical protein [Actinomycetota bacterium]